MTLGDVLSNLRIQAATVETTAAQISSTLRLLPTNQVEPVKTILQQSLALADALGAFAKAVAEALDGLTRTP